MTRILKIIVNIFLSIFILLAVINIVLRREFSRGESVLRKEDKEEYIDRAYIVEKSEEALDVRLNMLDKAEKFVDIAYYKIDDGDTSIIFLAKILEAAERGVKIRVYLDGVLNNLKGNMKDANYAFGVHPNIEYKLHYPININSEFKPNNRLHDKIIIVDNQIGLIGGRNIGDRFFTRNSKDFNAVLDRDILIYNEEAKEASVIRDIGDYYNQLWTCKGADSTYNNLNEEEKKKGKEFLEKVILDSKDMIRDRILNLKTIDFKEITKPVKKMQYIHNSLEDKDRAVCYQGILELSEMAKEEIIYQSPYIILSRDTRNILNKYDIDFSLIKILTNSYYSSPNVMAISGYHNIKKELINKVNTISEYVGYDSIHGKSYIFDEKISVIGTFNLDPRSVFLSTESYLIIYDEELAKTLKSNMEDLKATSIDGRDDLSNELKGKEKITYNIKKLLIIILSKFTYFIEYLL